MKYCTSLFYLGIFLFLFGCSEEPSKPDSGETVSDTTLVKMSEIAEEPAYSYSNEELVKLGIDTAKSLPLGLKVGDTAPDFSGTDQYGNPFQLSGAVQGSPVVLFFYRGYWCPVCNRYLSAFKDSVGMFIDKRAQIIAVAPETAENVSKTMENTGIKLSVIADTEGKIMKDYRLAFSVTENYQDIIRDKFEADIAETNGQSSAELPVPATFIIDENMKIKWAFFDPNYRKRASVKDILDNL